MPTYEYRCRGCGREWDEFHSPSHKLTDTRCPSCDKRPKQTEFSLNGSFYIPAYAHPVRAASWSQIAPRDEEGKAMTIKEAARAGYTHYNPGEAQRVERDHQAGLDRDVERNIDGAMKEAWDDRKVRIR